MEKEPGFFQGVMKEIYIVPAVTAVVDLGENNKGSIHAADVIRSDRERMIEDSANPEYYRYFSGEIGCVDTRHEEDGSTSGETVADGSIAGGPAVTEPMVDFMVSAVPERGLKNSIAHHVKRFVTNGIGVKVHGDNHRGKAGCGANANKREILRSNGDNVDIVVPRAWALAEGLGLDGFIEKEDAVNLVLNGANNAEKDELWDATPAECVDVAIDSGAKYVVLEGEHHEKLVLAILTDQTFDRPKFMADHPREDGEENGLFPVSLKVYKDVVFDTIVKQEGKTEREAALRVMAAILFAVGTCKELTAEDQGKGEALPVIIVA